MSEEAHQLEGAIAQGIYERFWDGSKITYSGLGEFTFPSEEEWAALGEDDLCAPDLPIILKRADGGTFFEVDVDITVRETSPESRQEERRHLAEMRQQVLSRRPQG